MVILFSSIGESWEGEMAQWRKQQQDISKSGSSEKVMSMLSNSEPWPAVARPGTWERHRKDNRSARRLDQALSPLSPAEDRSEASSTAVNLTSGSIGSINMSVDINGTIYAGEALGAPGRRCVVVSICAAARRAPFVTLLSHTFSGLASLEFHR